ncbi:MAG TPA: hypothetical protein VFI22_05310 [Thermomicrobiales bacterium]|nr:hypothetical protein [Thermomicrobiales bacterium]
MEAKRDAKARSGQSDPEDDAWTPADPDPRDAFDETLPADRADREAATNRERQAAATGDE